MDSVNYNNNDYRESGMSSPFATLMSMHSVATAAVSLNWNIRGYQKYASGSLRDRTIAIGDAYHVIKSTGRAKVMLAGGSESLKEQFNVVNRCKALAKNRRTRA